MKRGGQEIFVGPLGHQSSQLIKYFEVICTIKQQEIVFGDLVSNIEEHLPFVFRRFQEYLKSKMVIIPQLGCWKFLLHHKNKCWGSILLKYTKTQTSIG